jgi:hypothetical protein
MKYYNTSPEKFSPPTTACAGTLPSEAATHFKLEAFWKCKVNM